MTPVNYLVPQVQDVLRLRSHSVTRQVLLSILLAATWLAVPAGAATITQKVVVSFGNPSPQIGSPSFISDTHTTFGATTADLQDILAQISGNTFASTAAAGVFGDVGLALSVLGRQVFGPQIVSALVTVEATDLFTNNSGTPLHVQSNFVVDGGSLQLIPDLDSFAEYTMQLSSRVNGANSVTRFFSNGRLAPDPVTHSLGFTSTGTDLGTIFPAGRHNDEAVIPASLQTADLGTLAVDDSLSLFYSLELRLRIGELGELASGNFSDPLSLSGNPVLGTLVTTPVTSTVPEPSSPALLGLLVVGIFVWASVRRKPTQRAFTFG